MNMFQNEGKVKLDPRTKLLMLFMISTFVFAGLGGDKWVMNYIRPILVAIPFILLLIEKRYKLVSIFGLAYIIFYVIQIFLFEYTKGIINFILLFSIGTFVRTVPGVIAAYYLFNSTTISELVAALEKMRFSNKIIIPLAVMFRFFPTVYEESNSISSAMRMRGIYFGGKKTGKIIEYRLIPMITCSVKAGEELSMSALTRGLASPHKRTNLCVIAFNWRDYLLFTVFLLLITAFFIY